MSPRIFLTLLLCLLAHAGAAADLQFGKPLWGFDGTATENAFNLLSIEVRNTGGTAFDGAITLDSSSGGRVAAPYTAPVFLAPGTSRWVQFYPYLGTYISASGWELSWKIGDRSDSVSLEQDNTDTLKDGPPAVVILASLEDPTLRGTRIPVFDEALFPPTVAATAGLHAVILDHQPRLDPVRRAAFLDWLRGGGIVHLLPGPDGVFPEFTDEFAPLNFPGEKTRIGAGTVAKHTATRGEITPALLATAGYPAPTISPNSDSNNAWHNHDTQLLAPLAALTKPNIAWPLIYLLTIIYVALIGPTFYLLRKRDYRLLLSGFILTIAAFAWLFTAIGKRGYGEKQIYHSIGIARALGGDRWDVRHWTHTFATTGDRYALAYPGGGQLFAAISTRGDAVRATILHGKDSALLADIPLFSSRPFMHRGTMTGPDFALTITKLQHTPSQPGTLGSFAIRTGPGFPADIQLLAAAAEHRGNYYQLIRKGDTLTTTESNRDSLASALGGSGSDNEHQYQNYGYNTQTPAVALQTLRDMAPTLARHISNTRNSSRTNTALDPRPDTIRIYLYAPGLPAFRLANDRFQAGTEFILYTQDLPVPVSDL